MNHRARSAARASTLAALLLVPLVSRVPVCRADYDIIDMWDNGSVFPGTVFPNWKYVWAASDDILLCNGCIAATEVLTGVTVTNYGSATNADIAAVYFQVRCGATVSPLYTMTYGGLFTEESGVMPAWTWAGTTISLAGCADLCGGTCGGYFTINVFADIAPCPTELRTVKLGFPFHSFGGVAPWWGSITDVNGYVLPWGDLPGPTKQILITTKEGPEFAAPGDTVTYTITYGRPGANPLANIFVLDTLPPYTHYLPGSAIPAPDVGWDPDWGPPVRLKWSLPGGATTGGPTSQVTFKVTVDWGNGESFEPGSGDVAPPEGARLANEAHVTFDGSTCPATWDVTGPVTTSARRFLFWKEGDNDLLFSSTYGQSPDEMTYSIYLKNVSATKTWWNVDLWDTVPVELDPWGPNLGFDDPCTGWTMTPSGCAAGTPGWTLPGGGRTLLTWRLDMPPGMTLTMRWKAQVKPTATGGATALNVASVLERGRVGIINGTGSSQVPKNFTHQAPILLPTTYTSYLGFGTVDDFSWSCPCPDGTAPLDATTYYIAFYPLNKKTDFTLYNQLHPNDLFVQQGGLSPPISSFVGGCLTTGPDWLPGCKVERAPAVYRPAVYASCTNLTVTRNLYKLISNAPLIWELLTAALDDSNDQGTYSGTTSLTYTGYTTYSYARVCDIAGDARDGLYLINTSPTLGSSFHLFWWDATMLAWTYQFSRDLAAESQSYFALGKMGHWRAIASSAPMIVYKGYPGLADVNGNNNHGVQVPCLQNGFLVPGASVGDFYVYAGGPSSGDNASITVGNFGAATASYQVWEYQPNNPTLSMAGSLDHLTPQLVDSGGSWRLLTVDTVPAGIATAGNPHIYGAGFDATIGDAYALYKIHSLGGGPVQVYGGRDIDSPFSSGHVIHAADTPPSGALFWFHHTHTDASNGGSTCPSPYSNVYGLDFYCPKKGTAVQMVSGSGYSARYTTDGPDECIFFQRLTTPVAGDRENWKATVTGGIVVSAFKVTCQMKQKLYTAPFLGQGVHYQIIAPPVAFVGQTFWITVIVMDVGNTTKDDYCGTTSFTGTDPTAKIEGGNMGSYDFTWSSSTAPCNNNGAPPDENGVRVFVNVTLTRLGLQTIAAADTVDGSITGLATIMVVGLDIKLEKRPRLTVGASGDTVSFQLCWSNYSSASAFTFVITDAVPMGTTFLPEAGTASFDCGNTDGTPPRVAYSTTASVTPPAAFTTSNPLAGTRWLRFTIPAAGVSTTGCVCYRVTVN